MHAKSIEKDKLCKKKKETNNIKENYIISIKRLRSNKTQEWRSCIRNMDQWSSSRRCEDSLSIRKHICWGSTRL